MQMTGSGMDRCAAARGEEAMQAGLPASAAVRWRGRALLAVLLGGALLLAGCSSDEKLDPFAGKGSPKYTSDGPLPKGGGRRHVGKPYTIAGKTYYPTAKPKAVEVGMASWYGPKFHRRKTANGEWFDMNYLSAAHKTMPLPSYVRVVNLENGRTVVVRVNDRGPFVGTRIIDMSKAAAEVLGFRHKGKARVRVEYLGPAPLGDDRALLARLNRMKTASKARLVAAVRSGAGGRAAAPVMVARAEPAVRTRAHSANVPGDAAYIVQVASFSDPQRAEAVRQQLAGYGPAHVMPVEVNGMRYWRVRMGPFANPVLAGDARAAAARAGMLDARIITVQATGG